MINLNNISIKKRFFILFLICIIAFIGFGTFTLDGLNNSGKITQNLYNQSSKVSEATVNGELNLIKIKSSLQDVILSSNSKEIQSQIDKVNQYEIGLQKNLDDIGQNSTDSNTKRNLQDANNLLSKWWTPQRDKIIKDVQTGKKDDAIVISEGISSDFVDQLEIDLNNIYLSSSKSVNSLIVESNSLQSSQRTTLILVLIILISILTLAFVMVIRSILDPIKRLKEHMVKATKSGNLEEFKITQKNEICAMAEDYNILINKLKNEFWINTTLNSLNAEMGGTVSVKEVTQSAINFLSRSLDAGKGIFYIHNDKENNLMLNSSFAFTERERLSNKYELGEGIVGQVALERKSILLNNVKKSEAAICSGTIYEAPLNVYAFPLIYEDELYGVIELSSFEVFNKLKQQFIEVASSTIAINLYTTLQNQRIKELLEVSEKATKKSQATSLELINANQILEEQQRQLQIQTEEVQQTNTQLEEQQQVLEQQSEEMQQTNTQLEEDQLQIGEQSKLLNIKNEELEKSGQEILERSKDFEMANTYKSQFLANVSHELKTPLNSIILLSNLLIRSCKDTTTEDAQEKIKVIFDSGQHLLSLINDFLDLSKIEAGKIELNYRNFNTSELIEELKDMFNEAAMEKDIQFILEDQFKDNIYGEKEKISQIVRNFLSNAFKFTDKGTVKLKIEMDPESKNNVVFSVMDTGIGIPKNNLDTIFEEFRQGDGSISRKYGGTGLGLSISSRLCDLMKGKIKVSSELGMGSTFLLYLPITVSQQVASKEANSKEVTSNESNSLRDVTYLKVATSKQEAAASMCGAKQTILKVQNKEIIQESHKTLLIIEDDINLICSIKAVSEGIGFETLISNSGAEGLKIIKENEIDGILLDLSLPNKNGISYLKEINNVLKLKNLKIPVIIYSDIEISKEQEKEIKLYDGIIIIKTINSHERLLDELILILHKVKSGDEYKNIITSKINKDIALNLDNKKILIVDDDPRNIFVLAAALEDYGAEIIEAENGKAALEKLEDEDIDLILMDIMMPVMNGYEAIKCIRNSDKIKHIPIIATTAKSLKGDNEKCMEAGANDYISKPIDYDVLITLVKAWINKA